MNPYIMTIPLNDYLRLKEDSEKLFSLIKKVRNIEVKSSLDGLGKPHPMTPISIYSAPKNYIVIDRNINEQLADVVVSLKGHK